MENSQEFDKWARFYEKVAATGEELLWPSETLIRLFRGSYVPGMPKSFQGASALDVGCGNGNNLIFLASLGLNMSASEVEPELCRRIKERLARLGHEADVRVGTNRSLPFEANSFDYLVSWNVVHYEDNEMDIRKAFSEYARVLKPGGKVFLSTTGPEHKILRDSERVGPHRYRIGRTDDFRRGQVFYYFDDPPSLQDHMTPAFDQIRIGRTHDFLMTETLDWFIATGIKACITP